MKLKSIWVWDKIDSIETLLANIADGVIVTDAQGRIVILNSAAEKIFGLSREKTEGNTGHQRLDSLIKQSIQGKKLKEELTLAYPQKRIIKVKTVPLKNKNGEITGAIAICGDVTKVRQLEKIREEFIANVSHELRTPISAIRASAETLLNGAQGDPRATKQFLENIHKESERLSFLVADILDLSRLESDKIRYPKRKVPISKIVNEITDRFSSKAKEKQIKLKTKTPLPSLELKINEKDIALALSNLLDNACKYTPIGGEIEIEVKEIKEQVVIFVKDTGIGIPPQDLPRIFERFYRVDKGRSRETGGTGIGLSIVKHVAEKHGGRAQVESNLGKGSKFTILLPK
ncbi:MAG: PAS domain S-box protein [Actinobacteria bacterium]|nr:PAS domain S-box protein [Actinomycetota bacterium]